MTNVCTNGLREQQCLQKQPAVIPVVASLDRNSQVVKLFQRVFFPPLLPAFISYLPGTRCGQISVDKAFQRHREYLSLLLSVCECFCGKNILKSPKELSWKMMN